MDNLLTTLIAVTALAGVGAAVVSFGAIYSSSTKATPVLAMSKCTYSNVKLCERLMADEIARRKKAKGWDTLFKGLAGKLGGGGYDRGIEYGPIPQQPLAYRQVPSAGSTALIVAGLLGLQLTRARRPNRRKT